MEKQFKHKEGNIKMTEDENVVTFDSSEKNHVIKVDKSQPRETFLQEVEDKLNLVYSGSPHIIKDFIQWLEEVI